MMWVWGWVYWEHSDNSRLQKTEHQWQESLGQKRVSQAEEEPGSRGGRGGGRKASRMGHQSPMLLSPALPRPQPSFPPWAWEQGLCHYSLRCSFHGSTPLNTPGEEGLRGAVGTWEADSFQALAVKPPSDDEETHYQLFPLPLDSTEGVLAGELSSGFNFTSHFCMERVFQAMERGFLTVHVFLQE